MSYCITILFLKGELQQLEDTVNQRFDTLLVSHAYCRV